LYGDGCRFQTGRCRTSRLGVADLSPAPRIASYDTSKVQQSARRAAVASWLKWRSSGSGPCRSSGAPARLAARRGTVSPAAPGLGSSGSGCACTVGVAARSRGAAVDPPCRRPRDSRQTSARACWRSRPWAALATCVFSTTSRRAPGGNAGARPGPSACGASGRALVGSARPSATACRRTRGSGASVVRPPRSFQTGLWPIRRPQTRLTFRRRPSIRPSPRRTLASSSSSACLRAASRAAAARFQPFRGLPPLLLPTSHPAARATPRK